MTLCSSKGQPFLVFPCTTRIMTENHPSLLSMVCIFVKLADIQAFGRLISDAKSTKFTCLSVFAPHFEEVATLDVSKEALEQGSLTLASLPSSRTVAALLLLYLRELNESLLDPTIYTHLCEAKGL